MGTRLAGEMNPDKDTYFNQVADDRDHAGMVLPTRQKVDYGWGAGKERPVYFAVRNRKDFSTIKTAVQDWPLRWVKYASSFTLGAKLLAPYYPEFSEMLLQKAKDAYRKGAENPGVCQTAPGGAPYFTKRITGLTICSWLLPKCIMFSGIVNT